MDVRLPLVIQAQPDLDTCGPTCLQAVYAFQGDDLPLGDLIAEIPRLPNGGTLAVHLAHHALRRGHGARIFTYNLQVFDPTWFELPRAEFQERLRLQLDARTDPKLREATAAYLDFLELGGEIVLEDPSRELIRAPLERGLPILTGLSSTYLYRAMRERPEDGEDDDIAGEPMGHFVVICGYSDADGTVLVADPLQPNPVSRSPVYAVPLERLLAATLLGIVTYDANLLVVEPRSGG